jgi:hypothetical protein
VPARLDVRERGPHNSALCLPLPAIRAHRQHRQTVRTPLVFRVGDQNGVDCASATRRPGARPPQFGTLSPSASHPCSPATQTNCAHALSFQSWCLLSARQELCTSVQFCMLIAIDAAPESYALVNSHCCDTIQMSFVIFVCDFSGARSEKSSPVSAYF